LRDKIKELLQGSASRYHSVVDVVAKIDEHNVKRFCAETPVAR